MNNNEQVKALKDSLDEVLLVLKEANSYADKRNRLAKKKHKQSVLNYEQIERQYLIEKSHIQPVFRLSVTEFLTCEPDFVNDPEQGAEAKYLDDLGVKFDERVMRIKVDVKGDEVYTQPSIVIKKTKKQQVDDRAFSMTKLRYFVTINEISFDQSIDVINVYLVYRDKTTLPVIHKYQLVKRSESTLLRWDALLVDTAYVSSHKKIPSLKTSDGCANFFRNREEA